MKIWILLEKHTLKSLTWTQYATIIHNKIYILSYFAHNSADAELPEKLKKAIKRFASNFADTKLSEKLKKAIEQAITDLNKANDKDAAYKAFTSLCDTIKATLNTQKLQLADEATQANTSLREAFAWVRENVATIKKSPELKQPLKNVFDSFYDAMAEGRTIQTHNSRNLAQFRFKRQVHEAYVNKSLSGLPIKIQPEHNNFNFNGEFFSFFIFLLENELHGTRNEDALHSFILHLELYSQLGLFQEAKNYINPEKLAHIYGKFEGTFRITPGLSAFDDHIIFLLVNGLVDIQHQSFYDKYLPDILSSAFEQQDKSDFYKLSEIIYYSSRTKLEAKLSYNGPFGLAYRKHIKALSPKAIMVPSNALVLLKEIVFEAIETVRFNAKRLNNSGAAQKALTYLERLKPFAKSLLVSNPDISSLQMAGLYLAPLPLAASLTLVTLVYAPVLPVLAAGLAFIGTTMGIAKFLSIQTIWDEITGRHLEDPEREPSFLNDVVAFTIATTIGLVCAAGSYTYAAPLILSHIGAQITTLLGSTAASYAPVAIGLAGGAVTAKPLMDAANPEGFRDAADKSYSYVKSCAISAYNSAFTR